MLRAIYENVASAQLGEEIELSGNEAHHLSGVRRVRTGEVVELMDGRGTIARAQVTKADRRLVRLLVERVNYHEKTRPGIHLLVGIPKGKVLDHLIQKSVELGVARITPLITRHSELPEKRLAKKEDRWEQVIIEAVKQSGNPYRPILEESASFHDTFKQLDRADIGICGALVDGAKPLNNVLETVWPILQMVNIFVGPEGDFSQEEYDYMREAGIHFATLGPLVLRVETAASLIIGAIHLKRQQN